MCIRDRVITPVLMLDPVPFGSAADADPLFLLQSSLWSALLGDKRESYQANEDSLGRIPVPASDVDVAAARLYGDVKLEHQSFTVNYVDNYVYDEDTKTYYVQVTGQVGLYTPNVEEIVKKGNQYTLLVGYVPPNACAVMKSMDLTAGKHKPPPLAPSNGVGLSPAEAMKRTTIFRLAGRIIIDFTA